MKISNRTQILVIFLSINLLVTSQSRNRSYLSYIEQYCQLAEKQQKEHGIPASIILAQGLLESGAGQSSFAKESNNHFGIKCNEWTGAKIYRDDDKKDECFRKYDQVLDSYEDHAVFLKGRSRYTFLFELKPTDYEGWAHGLRKAGYATDPAYAYKLISIIENYNLHQYDMGENSSNNFNADNVARAKLEKNENHGTMGTINAMVSHSIVKVNKVKFVTSLPGDTYATIADEFRITEERLRNYNEVNSSTYLKTGTRVFIDSKRNKAPKDNKTHTVQPGESMRSISQDYAIKTVSLYKMNKMTSSDGAKQGQILRLR